MTEILLPQGPHAADCSNGSTGRPSVQIPTRVGFAQQPVGQAQSQHYSGDGENSHRVGGLEIQNNDFPGNGHQRGSGNQLYRKSLSTQVEPDVDEYLNRDEHYQKSAEKLKYVIHGQKEARFTEQQLHPHDIDYVGYSPDDNQGHHRCQDTHRCPYYNVQHADHSVFVGR